MDPNQSNISSLPQLSYLAEAKKENPILQSTSLGLLKVYGTQVKRLNGEKLNEESSDAPTKASSCQALSTTTIMKLARARLLHLNSQNASVSSILISCYGAQSDQPPEVVEDLELAILLLASAEKVSNKKFVCARKLLACCNQSASINGNPVQRIVYYFAKALQERINREWGINSPKELEGEIKKPIDVLQTLITLQPETVACQQEYPLSVISQCIGIQSILDSVASAKRVHIIDLGIKNGSHWAIMMQALAARHECPLELLKITAVGTSKEIMEETGKWLSSFAETMNLSFSFKIALAELKDLKEDQFEFEADEMVAVYSSLCLWTVLAWPSQLEALIGVIKNLRPCVMVVNELEASINSPVFMERFTEALFYFSAVFDCLKVCMDNQPFRKLCEEVYLWDMIRNIITAEGTERIQRHERVNFWRVLFARFGIVESELGQKALSQANLLLKRSVSQSCCTLDMDGKCLILSWKGTPIEWVSAWEFHCD